MQTRCQHQWWYDIYHGSAVCLRSVWLYSSGNKPIDDDDQRAAIVFPRCDRTGARGAAVVEVASGFGTRPRRADVGLALLPPSAPIFSLAVVPIAVGWHGLNVILNASLSCDVPEKLAGTMMGMSMAPMTATFLLSPMISATLFKAVGFKCVAGVACASLVGSQALVVALNRVADQRDESDCQNDKSEYSSVPTLQSPLGGTN